MKQIIVILLSVFLLVGATVAQEEEKPLPPATPAQCGEIVEGEFVKRDDLDSLGRIIWFTLDVDPGTKVTLVGNALGERLNIGFGVFDPARNLLAYINTYENDDYRKPTLVAPAFSSTGTHYIAVTNVSSPLDYKINGAMAEGGEAFATTFGVLGFFTVEVHCELSNGEIIAPGIVSGVRGQTITVPDTIPVTVIPLALDSLVAATVIPGTVEPIGYTISTAGEGSLILSLERISGNASSGVVIFAPNGSIVFVAAMIGVPSVSISIAPLEVGQYTLVAYPLDIAQPVDTQPAIIQIQARLKR
jgi:hypothetical protein